MIYDSLSHIDQYQGIHPGVFRGLELLRSTDFSKLEDGRHEVDGSNLFFLLQSYDTNPVNNTPEAHKDYLDIQYLISGREWMGVAPLEAMTEEVEGHPERDIWFYHGPVDNVLLEGDRFVALWPGDAHAPGVAVDAPAPVRKCVVKVRLSPV